MLGGKSFRTLLFGYDWRVDLTLLVCMYVFHGLFESLVVLWQGWVEGIPYFLFVNQHRFLHVSWRGGIAKMFAAWMSGYVTAS